MKTNTSQGRNFLLSDKHEHLKAYREQISQSTKLIFDYHRQILSARLDPKGEKFQQGAKIYGLINVTDRLYRYTQFTHTHTQLNLS